jgi:hypothetical protein
MIHGITAQARGALGGTGGDPGEILFADFMANVYRLNGASVGIADLFDGIDVGADLDPSAGLTMRYSFNMSFGSYPTASAALLAALKAQLPDGVSIDIEWWQNGGYSGTVPFVIFSETGDIGTDSERIDVRMGDNRVSVFDRNDLSIHYNLGNNPRYPSRGAATVNHRIDASTWQSAVASNGSTVLGGTNYVTTTDYDATAGWEITGIPFFHAINSGWLSFSAEGVIRAIRITTPVDFATLEARAVQPSVPTLAQIAPPDADVALLLSFEGTQGDTSTTDRSTYANGITFTRHTCYEFPYIDEAQSAIGGSSYRQDGQSQGTIITMDSALDRTIGSEPFSIDFFVRMQSGTTDFKTVCGLWGVVVGGGTFFSWRIRVGPAGLRFQWSADGSTSAGDILFPSTNATEQWIHYAVSMNAYGRFRVHRNGQLIGASLRHLSLAPYDIPGDKLYLGHHFVTGSSLPETIEWLGWIDEFRMVLGSNPFDFDGNFAVPTAAYPTPV